jgi:ATP-binding cassette subfamily F protein 3
MGANSIEAEIEKILLGLGFTSADFSRQTHEFSGGWRMRIELAKLLLKNSDLLLLDEPTNHLDIESIQWLEEFLKNYPGAIVLISHDRAFLDNLTNRTIEISLGKIYDYQAAYTKYLKLREERREQQLAAYQNQQKQIKQTEQFIERFRAKATKAVQVQSRIKQLDKLERIEIEEEDTSSMRFSFPPAPHSGKVSLKVNNLKKAYDEKLVFKGIDLTIERGEKVALVGKNGEGKSTFSRLIMGEKASGGKIEKGHQVKIGYYAQNQAEILDAKKTVFETIDEVATGEIRKKVRTLLGSFLFQGEEVEKKVSVLSGGERARLALCKLLLEPVNLLLLDEPTNHLDILSKEILKDALHRFDGTLLIISHDRDFLKGLADKVVEFRNGIVKEHLGGIDYFLQKKKATDVRSWETTSKTNDVGSNATNTVSSNSLTYEERKLLKKKHRKQKQEVQNLEKEIAKLEAKLEEYNQVLKDPGAYQQEENQSVIQAWEIANKKLQNTMELWEKAVLNFDELERKVQKLN